MAQEPVVVQTEDGQTSTAQAEVVRYSNAERITKATLFVIAGLIGGTVCIIVPVLHFITTWGFPLLGILMAMRTMKREVSILQPQGPCPGCGQPLDMAGGAMIDEEWQVCPLCRAKLVFRVEPKPLQ
jgi:hypothetical protein